MGVLCQILLQKPQDGIHRAGCAVRGTVKYKIDKGGKFQNITLSLIGKGKCVWSESRAGSSNSTSSTTYVGKEKYTVQYLSLIEKNGESSVSVPEGTCTYDFQFILPENIPPSYKDRTCTISYQVHLEFETNSFFSRNRKFSTTIPVASNLYPCSLEPITFGLQKNVTKPFSFKPHVIHLKADVEKTFITPGHHIKLILNINNSADVTITAVKTELIRYTTYTSDSGHKKISKKIIKEATGQTASVKSNSVVEFPVLMPTLPKLLSVQHSKILMRVYKVKVTVRLPIPHLNASVEMPVVLGERGPELRAEAAYEAYEDSPPSYWEVMLEDTVKAP